MKGLTKAEEQTMQVLWQLERGVVTVSTIIRILEKKGCVSDKPYEKTLEYLADDGVIAQGFTAARYRALLFEHRIGAKSSEFANAFQQSQITRRITMMTKNKSRGTARMKLRFALHVEEKL